MKFIFPIFCLLLSQFSFAQTIAEIQGTGDDSPYLDQVVTTNGIVTGTHSNGYYIQDGTEVRSGLYVYDDGFFPGVGDAIEITGTIAEFFNLTELVDVSSMTVMSSGNPLPEPIILTTNEINDEDYEGMLVRVVQATCSDNDIGFGEFQLNDGSGPCAVDDLIYLYFATEGIDYTITGLAHYSFNAYKIIPRNADDIEIAVPLYFTSKPKESDITTTSLRVKWETNVPANSILEYGTSADILDTYIENNELTTSHDFVLENLDPATIYYVRPISMAGSDETPTRTIVMASASESSGEIKAYFNHPIQTDVASGGHAIYSDDIASNIIYYIDQAQQTIDFTMYEAQNEDIVNALNAAYDRGVTVRVISDDTGDNEVLIDNLNSNIEVLEGNAEGIMHNKFMITDWEDTDNCWVLTGSMNHTLANLGWDYNNVITIQDQSLAKAYTLEFEEMWLGVFGSDKLDNTPHCFNINGVAVESYFSPSDGVASRIVKAIDAAENELAFAILVFTENSLGTAVLNAHNRGVDVKGIIDYVDFNGDEYDMLSANGVNVIDYQNADGTQWPDGPTLHHKYAIIDYEEGSANPLLITGSYNWTASAGSVHDENTLLIYDATVADWYQQEFWARFFGVDVATEESFVENKLDVSPNPASNEIQVDLPADGTLEVYDFNGKLLTAERLRSGIQNLGISNLSSGSYILLFQTKEGNYVERFVKLK